MVGIVGLKSHEICLPSIIELLVTLVKDSINVPASKVCHVFEERLFNELVGFCLSFRSVQDKRLESYGLGMVRILFKDFL